jgi:hypothetical protein
MLELMMSRWRRCGVCAVKEGFPAYHLACDVVRILTPLRHGHHFPDGPVLDEPSNEDMHRHANLDMTNRSRSQYSLGNTDPASRHSLGIQRLGGHPKIIRRYMGVCMTRLSRPAVGNWTESRQQRIPEGRFVGPIKASSQVRRSSTRH